MKNEKHVARARTMARFILKPGPMVEDEAIKYIQSMLNEVESEALASKVVFPDDEKFLNEEFPSKYWDGNERDSIRIALVRYRSQITLAPKEPEVKAQGFEEHWKNSSDRLNENSMLKRFAAKWFSLGQKSKTATLKLPERSTGSKDCYDGNDNCNHNSHSECDANIMYDKGFNDALDAVKSMNEGSGE